MQHVAALHGPDARRRSGEDKITGPQLEQPGEIRDHFRHLPDELVEVALLALLSIHFQPYSAPGRMADGRSRDDLRTGSGGFECLPDFPRPAELLRFALQVAPRHVEPDRIAEDVVQGLILRNVLAARLQRD